MKSVVLFDTSVSTDNIGDDIIMEAVTECVRSMRPDDFVVRVATHDTIGRIGRRVARSADLSFVGGTNLLRSNWFYKAQWKIGPRDFWRIGHPILMGVGWQYYQRKPDPISRFMIRHLLSSKYHHAVRDEYTRSQLAASAGVTNVLNTGCPTMWGLTEAHCARIPRRKAAHALVMLTAYQPRPEQDRQWLELVRARYGTVYFWAQMFADLEYARGLAPWLQVIRPSLQAYDAALAELDVDVIGTRLHGGIRALQRSRRALIIEIDNRATEIARDTGLPTVKRGDIEGMGAWISAPPPLSIRMPWPVIDEWKAQFSPANS